MEAANYYEFADRVRFTNRYVLDDSCRRFLQRLCKEAESRLVQLDPNDVYHRVQINSLDDLREVFPDADPMPVPLPEKRMIPKPELVGDGRINPRGIAYLYLADSRDTAVAEMRPVKGDVITVATFAVAAPTDMVDCRIRDDQSPDWGALNFELSFPVGRGETWRSYLPTQCIAEFFRAEGFNGLLYRSAMNEPGFNIALFDKNLARIKTRGLFAVHCVKYDVRRHEIFSKEYESRPAE